MPATYPRFRQLCAIVRQMITEHPTACAADLKDLIKRRHLRLGYRYNNQQIPLAMDAVERAMRRAGLTIGPVSVSVPMTRPPEAQQDPPWRRYERGPSRWTSTSDLATDLTTNLRSDRST